MSRRYIPALFVFMALAALAQEGTDPAEQGAALLAPFKANLKSALMEGMQGGPAVAIEVCSEDAPRIAASLSVNGVRMGRSSQKLRNPDNAPPEWLVPVLEAYASEEGELTPTVVGIDDERTGYAEPIRVQPMCLTCHGKNPQPDIAARLEALYPEDAATGFSEGDLRGVFWVEF